MQLKNIVNDMELSVQGNLTMPQGEIVLINPAQLSTPGQANDQVVPPMGLMYIASVLKNNNFKVKFIDALGENPGQYYKSNNRTYRGLKPGEILDKIHPGSRLIGISCMFSLAHNFVMALCKLIKTEYPNIKITLGGAHVTALPDYLLQYDYVDFVCLGESEKTFLRLCESMRRNRWEADPLSLSGIEGLGFKSGPAKTISRGIELLDDIDSLPYPDRDIIPLDNYFRLRSAHGSLRSDRWAVLFFSRGCPFDCSFCTTPMIWKRQWRSRDPRKVVDEIRFLQEKYGVDEIHFEDENMNTDISKLDEFCNELIKQKIKINWQPANGIRPHGLDSRIISKMYESGCTNIVLAPESGSRRVLEKIMNKFSEPEEISRVCRLADRHKIRTMLFFIMGLPGEKISDAIQTIKYMIRLAIDGADECAISLFVPLPGCRIFDQLHKEGRVKIGEEFFESLISQGDIYKVKSWSEYISAPELKLLQLSGYALFHLAKLFFHPLKTGKMFLNVLSGRQELKTERSAFLKLERLRDLLKSPVSCFRGRQG
jgi:radical SAM superfamily enzyme YgiQ (UPF0313 family)